MMNAEGDIPSPRPPDDDLRACTPAVSGVDALQPWEGSAILLVDLDAFFASVEQLDHPAWRGQPVIVGGDPEKRGVVSTCSYEARAFGVHSAMASMTAKRLCPQAIWTNGNFPRYIEMSKKVMSILLDESPHLQQVSIDEAFLDVSPGRFIKDHPVKLASRIRERVAQLGITCSIGVGTSKTIAKIASDMDKPNGLTVVFPGREVGFLSPLPVRIMSGVGKRAEEQLHAFGITTLQDMAEAEESVLRKVFGSNAQMMRNRCTGSDVSPVTEDNDVKSVSNELTFSKDLTELEDIKPAIAMMAAKVGRRLRRKGLAGYTVTLKLKLSDHSIRTAQSTLTHAVDDEQRFIPILYRLIDEVWQPGTSLRLIGVGVSSFDTRPEQLDLFDVMEDGQDTGWEGGPHATGTKRSLVEATDTVKNRFGEEAVRFGRELKFEGRDTGTVAQKKDDYKQPLTGPNGYTNDDEETERDML